MEILRTVYRVVFMANINSVYRCKLALLFNRKGHRFLANLAKNQLIYRYGIHLGLNAKIGKNLILPHPQGIIIGEGTEIGDNCTIYHNVTLGTKHSLSDNKVKYPLVGNNVTIYTGAVILGGVSIGNNSIIGAYSLVLEDVEPDSVYVGAPAKKVKAINKES